MSNMLGNLYIVASLAVLVAGFFALDTWAIGLGFVMLASGIIVRLGMLGQHHDLLMKPKLDERQHFEQQRRTG